MSEAITKTTQAVNKGLDQTKFCKHCGAEIDEDSAFCSKCGKPQ
jgi:predicted amidophosphoribosyltransferase